MEQGLEHLLLSQVVLISSIKQISSSISYRLHHIMHCIGLELQDFCMKPKVFNTDLGRI